MAIDTENEWLGLDEAATLLRVSKVTLQRWIKQGRLPAFRLGPRKLRIRRQDLDGLFTSVRVEPPSALDIKPLTAEEMRRGLEAIAAAEAFRKELLAKRGGKPFSSSVPIIRRARAERSKQLLG